MLRKITLYTEQEKTFLEGVAKLLDLKITSTDVKDTISHTDYDVFGTFDDLQAVASMMKANYLKNYR